MVRVYDAAAIGRALSYPALVDVLDAMFRTGCESPERHHHAIARDGAPLGLHLLMPAKGIHTTLDFYGRAPKAATADMWSDIVVGEATDGFGFGKLETAQDGDEAALQFGKGRAAHAIIPARRAASNRPVRTAASASTRCEPCPASSSARS